MSKIIFSSIASLSEIKRGDIIRHISGGESFIVDANYGTHVTAVTSKDITSPCEWVVLREVETD